MQKVSVKIPTGVIPRPVVARQSIQNAINRPVPSQCQDGKPELGLYKTSPSPLQQTVRSISGTSSVTNEFTTRTRKRQTRLPAKTSVVHVGNVYVDPAAYKCNARGVQQGFFPPLKIRGDAGGSMRTRYSTSAPARSGPYSPKNNRESGSPSILSKNLNVRQDDASMLLTYAPNNKEEWPKSAANSKRTNESPVRFRHIETFNPTMSPGETVVDMRVTCESDRVTTLHSISRNNMIKSRDVPFVRNYKLKQKQHKLQQIMDSNYRSPTIADLRDVQEA